MLNKALKLIRVFHDLTQKELAEKLGISKSHISEIESGKKTPTLAVLNRYAEFFQVPVSSIMFLSENLDNDVNPNEIMQKLRSSTIMLNWLTLLKRTMPNTKQHETQLKEIQ